MIIYEKPERLKFLCQKLKENFNDFKIVIIKEISKKYEESFFVSSQDIDNFVKNIKQIKGELTVIVEIKEKNEKVYTDLEIMKELKKIKPAQFSAMLSKSSKESRKILYKDV